jgi:hypothetical protein
MWRYEALKVIHILLFVFWLGTDIGVFYIGLMIRQPRYGEGTRAALGKAMHFLDQFPRTSLILMVPVSIGLTRVGGWGLTGVPDPVLWLVSSLAIVWAAGSVKATGFGASPRATRAFFLGDRVFRLLLVALGLALIIASLGAGGPIHGTWLLVKIALFATILLAGAVIDFLPNPFADLADITTHGSTPEREARLRRGLGYIYPVVVYIYLALVAMAIFAVVKF